MLAHDPVPVLRPGLANGSHRAIVAAVMMLVTASIVTQAYWLATGDDFGLGAVPAFNPAGIGNLPVFALTALLACSAATTAVLAAALRQQGAAGAGTWALLAAGQLALSVQRLVLTRPRINDDPAWRTVHYGLPPAVRPRDALLLVAVAAGVAVVAAAWRTAAAVRSRLATGAALFIAGAALGAVSGLALDAPVADPRVVAAALTIAARALELIGVALVLDAAGRRLAAIAPDVRLVVVDDAAPRAIGVRGTSDGIAIEVSPRRLGRALALAIMALVVLSTAAVWAYSRWPQAQRVHRMFYLDYETNVPTWWSAMLLLAPAAAAGFLARAARSVGDDRWPHWLALSLLFAAMAADEAASLHELMQRPLRAVLGTTWLRYPLIVPGLILGVVIALHFRRFMRTIGATRRRLAIGGAIFALGALVFEMVGGWFAPEAVGANTTYEVLTTIEETLEMTGAAVVLIALLRHVAHETGLDGLPLRDPGSLESADCRSTARHTDRRARPAA
jgi:hypothetical protein